MGCCKKTFLVIIILLLGLSAYVHHKLTEIPDLPPIDVEKWWGPGEAKQIDTSIRSFKIQFKEEMITDLKERLKRTTYTQPLEGIEFQYGFNTDYLKEITEFWRLKYDFTEREQYLNKYPHFKTNIQGLDIHYIHVKPKVSKDIKVLPLLMMHGWPGSFREFYGVISLLSTPRKDKDFVFEVIVPSMPGYGFSQAAAKPGLGLDQVAIVFRNLMHRLGHKKFYIQGGDLGSVAGGIMSTFFPEEVLAYHTNMPVLKTPLSRLLLMLANLFPSLLVAEKQQHLMRTLSGEFQLLMEESGYFHIQATKPDTIGVALRDSPAGLAAYILEKFSTGTNPAYKLLPDGGMTKKFTLTELLDNVMIYWSTSTMPTAIRMYAESFNKRLEGQQLDKIPVHVPTAIAYFRHEISYVPEFIMKLKYTNIVHFSHYAEGGHFAPYERPDVFAEDVWTAFTTVRNLENVKEVKSEL